MSYTIEAQNEHSGTWIPIHQAQSLREVDTYISDSTRGSQGSRLICPRLRVLDPSGMVLGVPVYGYVVDYGKDGAQ